MIARRLFASLIAVLCIAGWIGVESGRGRRGSDEITAVAGSGAVGCHSVEAKAQPRSPAPPRGLVAWMQASVASPEASVGGRSAPSVAAPLVGRRGDPGAPRGPPSSFVVS